MTLSDVGIMCGVCVSLLTPTGLGVKYWAEHEFITVGSFEQALNKQQVRDLQSDIRELEYLKQKDLATDRQLWKLEDLKQELSEIK